MEIIVLTLKFLSLMWGIAYSVSVLGAVAHGQAVSELKMYLMAVPVATFIFLQWIL